LKKKILHIIPEELFNDPNKHSGGAKGIAIFSEYLESLDIPHDKLLFKNRSDKSLLIKLKSHKLSDYEYILMHYTYYHRSCKFIKKYFPHIKLVVRAHNAEFPHWLQQSLVELKAGYFYNFLKYFYSALKKLWGEMLISKRADLILSINDWTHNNYWPKFINKEKIRYVPYFHDQNKNFFNPNLKKEKRIVCVMSNTRIPFSIDAAKNFNMLANNLDTKGFKFCITGSESSLPKHLSTSINKVGFVENLEDFLNRSKVVAYLTDYGYGVTTRILEAAYFGCWSLVTKKKFDSLEISVQKACMVIDRNNVIDSFKKLNIVLVGDSPIDPNPELKSIFIKSLNDIFTE